MSSRVRAPLFTTAVAPLPVIPTFLLRQRLPLPAPERPSRRLLGALVLAAVVAAVFVWMAVVR